MEAIPLVRSPKVRCAPFHLASGADPVGSAGSYDAYLWVEVPLPWRRDVAEHEPFAALGAGSSIEGADGRVWRPQALVPGDGRADRMRVLVHEQPGRAGPAAPYLRREWSVEASRVEPLCRALVAADAVALEQFEADRVALDDPVRDLMVCTHGRRDVCCGSSGTKLHEQLAQRLAGDEAVRLFRVSHTGGHRFAPTALTFPDGYAWAHLDVASALGIVRRDVPVGSLIGRCRGVTSVQGPAAQVADREVLARVGWSWCDATRLVTAASPAGSLERTEVRVDATLPDAGRVSAIVQVERAGEVPQPTCGADEGVEAPMSPVWRAARVDRLPVGGGAQ